jgi:excisionase family DNA binding protein
MSRPSPVATDAAVSASARASGRARHQTIQFFTIGEVAEMLRVSTRTVRRWIDRGQLVAHRFGGAVRIAERDLGAFLAIHREGL